MSRSIIFIVFFLFSHHVLADEVIDRTSIGLTDSEIKKVNEYFQIFEGAPFFSKFEKIKIGEFTILKKYGKDNHIYIFKNGMFLTEFKDHLVNIFEANTKVPFPNRVRVSYQVNNDSLVYGNSNNIFIDKGLDGVDVKSKFVFDKSEEHNNALSQKTIELLMIGTHKGKEFYYKNNKCLKSIPAETLFACCKINNKKTLMYFNIITGWKVANKKAKNRFSCDDAFSSK